jgi:hypothetical protein
MNTTENKVEQAWANLLSVVERRIAAAHEEGVREGAENALRSFLRRVESERWHNFPVTFREFKAIVDALLAALERKGEG